MKKCIALMLAVVMAVCMLAGCGGSKLTFATGGTTGTYYSYGSSIATVLSDETDLKINVTSTGASKANIQLIEDGDADIAVVQNDVAYYAYTGTDLFDGEAAYENLRTIGALYSELVHIVAKSSITSIEDLKGKTVSVGDAGSGTEFNAKQVLAAYGISFDDIDVVNLGFSDSADALKNGQVDAFFGVSGSPATYITDLAATNDFNLLEIDDEHADALKEEYGFYVPETVPGGTYSCVKDDVQTLAVKAVVVADASLSDDTVYELVKGLFDCKDSLAAAHAKGALLSMDTILDGVSTPLHAGAVRYFEEMGLDISDYE